MKLPSPKIVSFRSGRKHTRRPFARRSLQLAVVLALSALAAHCKTDAPSASGATNWVRCNDEKDCAAHAGASCSKDRYCLDRDGDRIPAEAEADPGGSDDASVDGSGGEPGADDDPTTPGGGGAVGSGGGANVGGDGASTPFLDGGSSQSSPCDDPGEACCDPFPDGEELNYCDGDLICVENVCRVDVRDDYVVCPEQAIAIALAQGGACNMPGLECSWGEDPRISCRTLATCGTDSRWSVVEPACETEPLPAECPAMPPTSGMACSDSDPDSCTYADGTRCACAACHEGDPVCVAPGVGDPTWGCQLPPSDPACPSIHPNLGTKCPALGTTCSYECTDDFVCAEYGWQRQPSAGGCPKCAAPNTPIATPDGDRAIASLKLGDLVYSVHDGAIVAVPITKLGSTEVRQHQVMRLVLRDGTILEISPGHPTFDGRLFGDLSAEAWLDSQHQILSAELVPYTYNRTYDILPLSDTGSYFAGGALIGSTLFDQ